MKFKTIIFLMMCMLFSCVAVSAVTVTQNSPGNNTYDADGDLVFNYSATDSLESTLSCKLFTSDDGTWTERETNSGVTNNTATTFTRNSVSDINDFLWNIKCSNSSASDWGLNRTLTVDTTAPLVNVTDPAVNATWQTTTTAVRIGLYIEDENANQCLLTTNMNVTTNTTGTSVILQMNVSYTNVTEFNFTSINSTSAWAVSNLYRWGYTCNDLAGNSVTKSGYHIYVDGTVPGDFDFNISKWRTTNGYTLVNDSSSTDYTPTIGWNISAGPYFNRYEINFYPHTVSNDTGKIQKNITTNTTVSTVMSTLAADEIYRVLVTAYDDAGNAKNMSTIHYLYNTVSTSRTLYTGWNLVMNLGKPTNLSNFLEYSGASQASYLNTSNEFQTFVSGGSWGSVDVPYGDAVFLYMAAAGTYEDFVVNTSRLNLQGDTLLNKSTTAWNVACNKNYTEDSFSFLEMDLYLNGNKTRISNDSVDYFSGYDASAATGSKYLPYVSNWTTANNNETTMSYGTCTWFHVSGGNRSINWSGVLR